MADLYSLRAIKPPRPFWALAVAVRAVIVVAFLALGWWTATRYTGLIAGPQNPALGSEVTGEERSTRDDVLAVATASGSWLFVDDAQLISVGTMTEAELRKMWSLAPAHCQGLGKSIELERVLLELAQSFGKPIEVNDRQFVYRHARENVCAEIGTLYTDYGERLAWGRAAYRFDDVYWIAIEMSVCEDGATASEPVLLPYPPSAVRLATRIDASRAVRAEFVHINGSLDQMTEYWKAAGGTTTINDRQGAADFQELIVISDRQVIKVYALETLAQHGTLLLTVRP